MKKFPMAILIMVLVSSALQNLLAQDQNKLKCEDLKNGVGYYFYYYKDAPPVGATLDPKSGEKSVVLSGPVFDEVMAEIFKNARDLKKAPFLVKDQDIMIFKLKGAIMDFNKKNLLDAAAKENLGYVLALVMYPSGAVTKEPKNISEGLLQQMPNVEIRNGDETFAINNFLFQGLELYEVSSGKKLSKSPMRLYFSYNDWFVKKYPGYFSGASDQLPEGVNYNDVTQYKAFLKESFFSILKSNKDAMALSNCSESGK